MLRSFGSRLTSLYDLSKNGKERPVSVRINKAKHFALTCKIMPYLTAFLILGTVTFINTLVFPVMGYESVSLIYLLTIMIFAISFSRGPIVFSTLATVFLWNFFFIPPRFTFGVNLYRDILMLGMYLITATVVGVLTSRIRENERTLAARQEKLTFLSNFSLNLSEQKSIDEIIRISLEQFSRHFDAEVNIFLKLADGTLEKVPKSFESGIALEVNNLRDLHREAAEWCFLNKEPSGMFTAIRPESLFHYLPLTTADSVLGVLGIRLINDRKKWSQEQEDVLLTLKRTLSLTLERELLAEQNRRMEMEAESERLGKILLNSISHELRTPLTTIKGSTSAILENRGNDDPVIREELLRETLLACDSLNILVENLLSMSRLESGVLKLRKTQVDVQDLAASAIEGVRHELENHQFGLLNEAKDISAFVDYVLIVQVIINLLRNASKHTKPGTYVQLSFQVSGDSLVISVKDNGPGVRENELSRIFDKFYRASGSLRVSGSGLGLAISRGVVEAHGGSIHALNLSPGLEIRIVLEHCIAYTDVIGETVI